MYKKQKIKVEPIDEILTGSYVEVDVDINDSSDNTDSEEDKYVEKKIDPDSNDDKNEVKECVPPALKTHSSPATPIILKHRPRKASALRPKHSRSSSSSRSPSPEPRTSSKTGRQICGSVSKRLKQSTSECDGGDKKESWRNPEEQDVEPPMPKFQPKNPVGPRINRAATWSPLGLFKLFFSSSVIHTIINNTNANAEKRKASGMRFKWSPLSVVDFHIFLSIILFSGMVRVHSRADMWRREWPYNFTFPRNNMTRERFETIFWSLHLCDINKAEENHKKKGTPQYDPLFKIKPLYSQIVNTCLSLFQPNREISIDERMVANRDRSRFRQSMKDKPTKNGYKLYVLADSQTGYTWNFFLYQGKSGSESKGLSYRSVMDLMNFDLLGKGYHLYVDNFYSSPELFRKLVENNTSACGTMRQSRVDFPKTTRNNLPKMAEKGDGRWLRKDNLLFVKWKDTKEVAVCSTIHRAYSGKTVCRKSKKDGQWVKKQVPIPDAIKDYNIHMGGVDLSDALIQNYSVQGKTMRWYKTLFYHFVDIAIVNSFILHKLVTRESETLKTQKQFREVLMKELVAESKAIVTADEPRPTLSNTCMPMYFGDTASAQRRVCVLCKDQGIKLKTPLYCSKCHVALCLTSSRNCFQEYHMKQR